MEVDGEEEVHGEGTKEEGTGEGSSGVHTEGYTEHASEPPTSLSLSPSECTFESLSGF